MADHLDAPGLTSPAMDARVDITDHYAFQQPGHPERTVLAFNVNPLAPTHADEFRHDALYETLVDTNGDAKPDITFRYRFSRKERGRQFARVSRAQIDGELEDGHVHAEFEIEELVEHAPVSFDSRARITKGEDDVRFFAGLRSDPFFFDLLGFLNNLNFTGSDFFLDKNVFGIVLEVPNKALGTNPNIGVWGRTAKPLSTPVQIDRVGRPAINTLFNHGADKNTFNSITPDQDRTTLNAENVTFLQSFESTLMTLGGYSLEAATSIAEILLPDILTYDFSSSAGFLNGRKLADDVIDTELALVTNGALKTDKVGPHTDYLSTFPYLGTPH